MPKPLKGMYKRPSRDNWYFRFLEHGKYRHRSLGTQNQKEAERRCGAIIASGGVDPRARKRVLVRDAVEGWLEMYIATARSGAKDRQKARSRAERYLQPVLGRAVVDDVTKDDLRSYRLWLERRKLAPKTVADILSEACCFLRWCEEAGYCDRAPIPRGLMPRLQERPPDRLTDSEVKLLLTLEDPWGFVIRFGLGTGLRWGEMARARTEHIEGRALIVGLRTKNKRMRRVPLQPDLCEEIRSMSGEVVPFDDASSCTFNRAVKRLSKVQRFHVHQLRHTFGCRWIERGGSLPALQQILGHRSVVMTQRYARLMDSAIFAEADRVLGMKPRV